MQHRKSHNSMQKNDILGIALIICPGAESATAIILKNGTTKNRIKTTQSISSIKFKDFSVKCRHFV